MLPAYSSINGSFLKAGQAALQVNDMAIQRGYAVFDFFKVVNKSPVFLDDHLDRFFTSAALLRLASPLPRKELKEHLANFIDKNSFTEGGVRITLTGGYAPDGYSIHQPNLIITAHPLTIHSSLQPGINLLSYQYQRQLPPVKSIDYLMAVWLQPLLEEQDVQDVLYKNNSFVTECPRSNFFIVTENNEVITPSENILQGVTRKKVIELCNNRYKLTERSLSLEEVYTAKEAFVTSTSRHILPVLSIDGHRIGNGQAGPTTTVLFQLLRDLVFNPAISSYP